MLNVTINDMREAIRADHEMHNTCIDVNEICEHYLFWAKIMEGAQNDIMHLHILALIGNQPIVGRNQAMELFCYGIMIAARAQFLADQRIELEKMFKETLNDND
jgi:hypothetical protein